MHLALTGIRLRNSPINKAKHGILVMEKVLLKCTWAKQLSWLTDGRKAALSFFAHGTCCNANTYRAGGGERQGCAWLCVAVLLLAAAAAAAPPSAAAAGFQSEWGKTSLSSLAVARQARFSAAERKEGFPHSPSLMDIYPTLPFPLHPSHRLHKTCNAIGNLYCVAKLTSSSVSRKKEEYRHSCMHRLKRGRFFFSKCMYLFYCIFLFITKLNSLLSTEYTSILGEQKQK